MCDDVRMYVWRCLSVCADVRVYVCRCSSVCVVMFERMCADV